MPSLRGILEAFAWLLAAALLLVAAAFSWSSTPIVGWLAPIGLLALAPLISRMVSATRRRRGAAVLSYVEQAVRLNLPLTRMLDAAQASEERPLAMRLGALSARLASGQSLGVAIAGGVPEVGAGATSMIAAAERAGRLPHALARLTRHHAQRFDDDVLESSFYRAYPFLMTLVIISLVSLIMVFVIPKFETIFHDFGLPLPQITQSLLDVARAAGGPLSLLAAIVLGVWLAAGIWRMFDPQMSKWNGPRIARDYLLWSLPMSHSLQRDRGLADALDLIHEAIRGGHSIEHAVEQASSLRVNEVLRRRLALWAAELRAGISLQQSTASAGLPRLIMEMLAPVRGGEQAADVLGFLSRYYEARFSRTRLLLRAASIPVTVLFFAIIVAWVALALMTPLIALMNHIAQGISVHL
jgi:type II secretory pathway component PulF